MAELFINIKKLVQVETETVPFRAGRHMKDLNCIEEAYLYVSGGKIEDFGCMDELPEGYRLAADNIRDLDGRLVLPTWCDSHTHIVYAGSREMEYIDKIKGLTYEEIARRGGGILNSARLLHDTPEDELYEQSAKRIREVMHYGTGAIEIKSGYGLNTADEIKMLRVIRRIQENFPLTVKATFLGAHSIPEDFLNKPEEYVDMVINEMIPTVAAEGLADYIDVFCDRGFFSVEDTERILLAGMKHGMIGKIHANELDYSGGVQAGVKYDALSVDHLEYTGEAEIKALLGTETMPTVLPGASFFLGMPYAPAREMIDAGLPLALASDYNPGSSPSGNMNFILSLACINLNMLPEEAINAITLNSAYAMGVHEESGSIAKGKSAGFIVTRPVPGYEFLPYAYGSDLIEEVYIQGVPIRAHLS